MAIGLAVLTTLQGVAVADSQLLAMLPILQPLQPLATNACLVSRASLVFQRCGHTAPL